MSAVGDLCKAAKAWFDYRLAKYSGNRADQKESAAEVKKAKAAKAKRIKEGWREKSASKILGG